MTPKNNFSETSIKSHSSRIKEALKNFLIAPILILASFYLLWWNEGRAINVAKGIDESRNIVVSIDSKTYDATNDGNLVHIQGIISNSDTLVDQEFKISKRALKLERHVEMYQWTEQKTEKTEKLKGGEEKTVITYSYSKRWMEYIINSSEFRYPNQHLNPSAMPFSSYSISTNQAQMGVFDISSALLDDLDNYEPLNISEALSKNNPSIQLIEEPWDESISLSDVNDLTKSVGLDMNDAGINVGDGGDKLLVKKAYLGKGNPSNPSIGDIKVYFGYIPDQTNYSILALQQDKGFGPYKTNYGTSIFKILPGSLTATEMLDVLESANTLWTWIFRLLGYLMMTTGFIFILTPLSIIFDVIPFLGNIAEVGVTFVAAIVSFCLSILTIAISWFYFRPILSVLLMTTLGLAFYMYRKKSKSIRDLISTE